MSVCPSCNLPSADSEAQFCARCGFALPDEQAGGARSFTPLKLGSSPAPAPWPTPEALAAPPWRAPSWAAQTDPRAVAVGLCALAAAVVLSLWLAYGPGSTPADHASAPASTPVHRRTAAAARPERPVTHVNRYVSGNYSFAYPRGWRIARGERVVNTFSETVLQRADGAAMVTVDYSPGETTAPFSKASQVEAETTVKTPGYRRISLRPTHIHGQPAVEWDFVLTGAKLHRVELFVRARGGDVALLADGPDLAGARSAARSIAGSLVTAG
jgi:hypothetical protein